jgi:hypothetical protein
VMGRFIITSGMGSPNPQGVKHDTGAGRRKLAGLQHPQWVRLLSWGLGGGLLHLRPKRARLYI